MNCSRCGKSFKNTNYLIALEQSIKLYQVNNNNIPIEIPNTSEPTKELLCEDCFLEYSDKIDELNTIHNRRLLLNLVETIDEVQYGRTKEI